MGQPRHKKERQELRLLLELDLIKSKITLWKNGLNSGFFETGLDPLLRSLYKGDGVKKWFSRLTYATVRSSLPQLTLSLEATK